jgi:hypothetical protein
MRITGSIATAVLCGLVIAACAPAMRAPLTDIPAGTYVLVEPETDVYNAVTINERAFSLRVGETIMTGEHWVDGMGRLHIVENEGPCAGQASVWRYDYTANRVTLELVEDHCPVRPPDFPERMVYQRR